MRVTNRSDLDIRLAVWRRIAESLGLDRSLPAANSDNCSLYAGKVLRVFVHPASDAKEDGAYCFGRIDIFTCAACTSGHVLWTFLHELVHAWFDSYQPERYLDQEVESVADRFADEVFAIAGGTIIDATDCSTYQLPADYSGVLTGEIENRRLHGAAERLKIVTTHSSGSGVNPSLVRGE